MPTTSPELSSIIEDLTKTFAEISVLFRQPPAQTDEKNGTLNPSGDQQIALDVLANNLLTNILQQNPHVALIASEELAEPMQGKAASNTQDQTAFSVTFDPLDGSSVIDANFTVGTIVALYTGSNLLNTTGRNIVASLLAIYGPKTSLLLATQSGVTELQWSEEEKKFTLHKENITLKPSEQYFSPGKINPDPLYMKLFSHWLEEGYKLRYSGCMAADINHIFTKGGGIFTYPKSSDYPNGKLRLLYECAPLAYMVEKAGGLALNQDGQNILDIPITDYHQTTPIFIGSQEEVEEAVHFFQS